MTGKYILDGKEPVEVPRRLHLGSLVRDGR
jgi:hypothetical protein